MRLKLESMNLLHNYENISSTMVYLEENANYYIKKNYQILIDSTPKSKLNLQLVNDLTIEYLGWEPKQIFGNTQKSTGY